MTDEPAPSTRRTRPDAIANEAATLSPRRRLLVERAAALGRTCAAEQRQALQAEGRRISGGWPGTVGQMRAWVNRALPAPGGRTVGVVTEAERDLATRTAYASARKEWTRFALHDEI